MTNCVVALFQMKFQLAQKDAQLNRVQAQLLKTLQFNTQVQEQNIELQKSLSLLCISAQKDIDEKDKRIAQLSTRFLILFTNMYVCLMYIYRVHTGA